MEGGGQILDELAEVHTLVGDVVEDGLVAVSLILHVADFHLQSEVLGNLSALYHRAVLAPFGLLVFLHIRILGDSVDALDVVGTFQVCLFHLQFHQSPSECHHADVVSRTGFHGHPVAFFQVEFIVVVVIPFSRILELHFHKVGVVGIARHVVQPVVGVQLVVLPTAAAATESAVAVVGYLVFQIFVIHTHVSPAFPSLSGRADPLC